VFTGLVQALGRIAEIRRGAESTRLVVETGGWPHRPDPGASIAVNGCCLTVVDVRPEGFGFDVIPQTLAVTSLGALRVGAGVNLEHAATPTTFLGGHVVLGHVDGLAEVVEIRTEGEWRVRLRLPSDLARFVVDKGSIALDGVSLTIARVADADEGPMIDVCLIPETLARTNLAERRVGDRVNVEADHLAKLVARQLEWIGRRSDR
jgi:riboflavin synthase